MTSDTGSSVRFHAHKNVTREEFDAARILSLQQFSRVDWETVHCALTAVPECFRSGHVSKSGGLQVQIESKHCGQTLVHCVPAVGKHLKRVAMFYIAPMMAE